ncbi:MAG: BMP family ABC transporter substrate-binding protein [Lachnospiraceae bacterium]|nr:BMP family ABC transporter substrate-binding protein [Lachnospiraceae bacterium]
MRKTALLSAILIFALLICSCGAAGESEALIKEWKPGGAIEAVLKADKKNDRVALIVGDGGVDDHGFNQSAWEGLQLLKHSLGTTVEYTISEIDEYEEKFVSFAENGYDLCWGLGYDSAEGLLSAAKKYPDVHFAIIDNAYEETPENVTSVVFRAQEMSFLVGYIAGAATKTGKTGFVGGVKSEVIDQFEYGFRAGAAYAGSIYGKDIEVFVEYVDNYYDDVKGKALAKEMYEKGADIIYAAAGGAGLGVIDMAKEAGKFVIGVDKDQSYLAPKNILTSGMKMVDVAIYLVSTDFEEGRDIKGKTISFGLAEGAVGIPENHDNYSDKIYDEAIDLSDLIKEGEIVPPSSEAEFVVFAENLK